MRTLDAIVAASDLVYAHRTFGDRPRGGGKLAAPEPRSAMEFVTGDDSVVADRWIGLVTGTTAP